MLEKYDQKIWACGDLLGPIAQFLSGPPSLLWTLLFVRSWAAAPQTTTQHNTCCVVNLPVRTRAAAFAWSALQDVNARVFISSFHLFFIFFILFLYFFASIFYFFLFYFLSFLYFNLPFCTLVNYFSSSFYFPVLLFLNFFISSSISFRFLFSFFLCSVVYFCSLDRQYIHWVFDDVLCIILILF